MSSVNDTLVREFLESRGFLVRQQRKFVAPSRGEEDEVDLLAWNPSPAPGEPPFELDAGSVGRLRAAVVAVKGWHSETFTAGMLTGSPDLFRFVEPGAVRRAEAALGGIPVSRVLVVPSLPGPAAARREAVAVLRDRGVDAVLPFREVLQGLLGTIEPNRNYQKSDVLQLLRILKSHGLFREPQLDLFRTEGPVSRRRRGRARGGEASS